MIINVKACPNRAGIIVSYLIENKEKTGYAFFNAKRFLIDNKTEMLATIKKTIISSRKLPEITADDFVSTINKISKKLAYDITLKQIVKTINDESMLSEMATLSHVFFNNKPLQQVKAINIINDNMYFMTKAGTNYSLELIERKKIKCVITVSSLVNLYKQIKQGTKKPLKKITISANPIEEIIIASTPTIGSMRQPPEQPITRDNPMRRYAPSVEERVTRRQVSEEPVTESVMERLTNLLVENETDEEENRPVIENEPNEEDESEGDNYTFVDEIPYNDSGEGDESEEEEVASGSINNDIQTFDINNNNLEIPLFYTDPVRHTTSTNSLNYTTNDWRS